MNKENVYYIRKTEEIKPLLEKIVRNNDVILFKASNGMQFYKIAEEVVNIWKRKS